MTAFSIELPARPAARPRLDLKWSLTLRVVAVALLSLLAAATIALLTTYRDVRRANEHVADTVARQVELQLFRIEAAIDVPARFPDWEPVTDLVQGAGQCIQYLATDGSVRRSGCVGFQHGSDAAPAWFTSICRWLNAARTDVSRPISYHGKSYGTLLVTTEPAAVATAIWKDVSHLLRLAALMVAAICVLQHIAVGLALRPTREILAGLERLSRGNLSYRLPNYRVKELQRISEGFNTLAANLDQSTRERTALAARLVDGQERERQRLARELHDELAQNLSAMNAVAAAINSTAKTQCPDLMPQVETLSNMATAIMRSLRSTLRTLRPPEIDDLGLAASLASLAADQERRSGGGLQVALDIADDVSVLTPTAASHVYRIVQEGLTNVAKHANATQARIVLALREDGDDVADRQKRWLALTIEDNGRGGAAAVTNSASDSGLGLLGMRERVTALGGRLDVGDGASRGFQLHALIPFEAGPEIRA